MGDKIKFTFNVDGIGPHYDATKIDNYIQTSAPQFAIYAENGTGKTFFTRMFALAENGTTLLDNERLISIGKNKGNFLFSIKDDSIDYEYSVSLENGKEPIVKESGKKYLYHVFNSDYVRDNIASADFSPNGDNVTGYILGKENIDVSDDKEKLKILSEQKEEYKKQIASKIEDAKKELSLKKINSSMNEFKEIKYDTIFEEKTSDEEEDYIALCKQLGLLKNMPENIPNIVTSIPDIYDDFMSDINVMLKSKFSKVHFDEIAMKKIHEVRNDTSFFEKGLTLFEGYSENVCPFCAQELNEIGVFYINLYKLFFEEEESNVLAEIDKQIKNIGLLENNINSFEKQYAVMSENFIRYRVYIPEMNQIFPDILPQNDDVKQSLNNIKQQLSDKKSDIEDCNFDISKDIDIIKTYISTLRLYYIKLYDDSTKLQASLNDTNKSRINLSRRICNSKRNVIIHECKTYISEIKKIDIEQQALEAKIKEKERKAKTSKKEVVIESLSIFLDYFFHKKYIFDSTTFGIQFKGESLDKKAKDVLSDGEKSIVAFCYYLASTHLLVNNESDYEDIFFIIDDPISSMDFHYVYAVADIIRHLKNSFAQINRIRYIIFTHNAEFMAMLYRNKIPKASLSMTKGKISKMNAELLMPYEHHLNDVLSVAKGINKPTHTIPNSIRQIIETIMRFETPKNNSTEKYIESNELLRKNSYIYSLMQDGSHGAVRKTLPIDEDTLKEACEVVIEFVKSKYPAQIEAI